MPWCFIAATFAAWAGSAEPAAPDEPLASAIAAALEEPGAREVLVGYVERRDERRVEQFLEGRPDLVDRVIPRQLGLGEPMAMLGRHVARELDSCGVLAHEGEVRMGPCHVVSAPYVDALLGDIEAVHRADPQADVFIAWTTDDDGAVLESVLEAHPELSAQVRIVRTIGADPLGFVQTMAGLPAYADTGFLVADGAVQRVERVVATPAAPVVYLAPTWDDPGCPWSGPITSASATMTTVTINGEVLSVLGEARRQEFTSALKACRFDPSVEVSFSNWRSMRRATNVSAGAMVLLSPMLVVAVISASQAGVWKRWMTDALSTEGVVEPAP